jgi:hypothetical protein
MHGRTGRESQVIEIPGMLRPRGSRRASRLGPLQAQPVIASFTATPPTISPGGSSTLAWSVTGADAISIDHGIGTVTGSSVTVSPAVTTT